MKNRMSLAGTVVLAVLAMLALAAGAVLGHAKLVSSDPADGASIKTPYTLTATFDEELTPDGSSIVVQNSTGGLIESGTVSARDPKQMTVELSELADGQYEVLWTAVTADDQGVTRGTYTFTVGVAGGAVSIPPDKQSPDPGASTANNKDLLIMVIPAGVILVGVVAFVLHRRPR